MAIRQFDVGPSRGLRRAAATDLGNLVAIAGPNGAGKSSLLDQLRSLRSQFLDANSELLFVGAHRTWRSGAVSEVAVLGFNFGFEDILKQDALPGFQYAAPGGFGWLGGLARTGASSADDAQALVKTALIRIYQKQRDLLTREFASQGGQVAPDTVKDLFKPFGELVDTLLPHLEWLSIEATNKNDIRCLFRHRDSGVSFDIDDLSSGEKSAIALFLPFVEREARILAGELPAIDPTAAALTLIIDEPEIHLHPLLQLNILDYMRRLANLGRAQFIFATHSPTLLDALDNSELYLLSPASIAGDNQLTRLSSSIERLEIARTITGSTHVLTRAKPIVLIEGEPDHGPTASDERLLRLLVPDTAHWAIVSMSGRAQVVKAAAAMRQAALQIPGSPVFAIVDPDMDVTGLPDYVSSWPVTMVENLLLDPVAIAQVAAPYAAVTGISGPGDASALLLQAARARVADEVRLRVKARLPRLSLDASDWDGEVALEQFVLDRAASFIEETAAAEPTALRESAQADVQSILEEGRHAELFHGKRLLRDLYALGQFGAAGFGLNAFVTELAREAARHGRLESLVAPTVQRVRLYFPADLAELVALAADQDAQAASLAAACRAQRTAWESGTPNASDREGLRAEIFGMARRLSENASDLAPKIFASAAEIGTP